MKVVTNSGRISWSLRPSRTLASKSVSPHRKQVVTGSLVAGGGTAVLGQTDFREPATTGSTFEETREKVARSARTLRADAFILGHDLRSRVALALFDPAPEMVAHSNSFRLGMLMHPLGGAKIKTV